MRQKFFLSFVAAAGLSFLTTTAWFYLFSEKSSRALDLFGTLAKSSGFWLGYGVWTLLFWVFFTLPIALTYKRSRVAEA